MIIKGKLWVETDQGKLLGPGRIELLERINTCGSLRQAALQMKMSYKKAWDLISDLNTQFSKPLVLSSRGGINGGNAAITTKGLEVITKYRELEQHFQNFLEVVPVKFQL